MHFFAYFDMPSLPGIKFEPNTYYLHIKEPVDHALQLYRQNHKFKSTAIKTYSTGLFGVQSLQIYGLV